MFITSISLAIFHYLSCTTYASQYCARFPIEFKSDANDAAYTIGGIFPVHYFNSQQGVYSYNSAGLTWIEAMRFAIEEINNSTELLNNTKLAFQIYDSCNTISIAVEAALLLTQGFQVYDYNMTCPCNETKKTAIAMVGDAASDSTTRVAAITAASLTAQISFSATSTDLSAKHLYPSFLRTIPPDNFQAILIADMMKKFKWKYINVLGSDDNYGRVGVSELLPQLKKLNICVAISEVYDIKNDRNSSYTKEIVTKLKNEKEATIIVLWAQRPEALKVLEEAARQQLYHRTWIGTESYGRSGEVAQIHPSVVNGMFGIIPAQLSYPPFEQRLRTIQPNGTDKNPWLSEYWINKKNCKPLPNNKYICDNQDVDLRDLPANKYVNVIDSVYSIAHALDNYLQMPTSNKKLTPRELLQYVKNVSFIGKSRTRVWYNHLGNPGEAIYSLTNLQYNTESKKLVFEEVGLWNYKLRNISFSNTLQFANQSRLIPRSSCAELCTPGQKGLTFGDRPCCLKCVKCPSGQIQPEYGKSDCIACSGEQLPNTNQTSCIEPQIQYLRANTVQGSFLIGLMVLGYLLVIFCIAIAFIFKDTPMVRAANRSLSLLQLVSMLFIFALPLMSFSEKPTIFLCGARLYYFVLFYSIAVSVTFTKADRLLRVFKASKSGVLGKSSNIRSNKIQYVTVFALSLVGVILCTVIYYPFRPIIEKEIEYVTSDRIHVWYYCSGYHDSILFVLVGFIAMIALICGVYAFKARKLPEAYNEARYTSFAMFTFLLVWTMFIPIYFSTKSKDDRIATWYFISYTSNLVLFLIMYMPKLFIILFRPQENTKENIRAKMKSETLQNTATITTIASNSPASSTGHVNKTYQNNESAKKYIA